MNKALEHYIKTIPGNHNKEDLTYAYPEGYVYTNGFSAIICNEEPDYKALATTDRGVRRILGNLTIKLCSITQKEIKEEIKKRGIKASEKLTSQRLFYVADYACFDIIYVKDILAVLGNCDLYWDGKILTGHNGFKYNNGLKFISDKGEALLLPVKTKEAKPKIDYPAPTIKAFPMYSDVVNNALTKMIAKWDKDYPDDQLRGHYSYDGKSYFVDNMFIIELNDRVLRNSDKHFWNEVTSAQYIKDITTEVVDEKYMRIIKRILGNITKQEIVSDSFGTHFAKFTGKNGNAYAMIAKEK